MKIKIGILTAIIFVIFILGVSRLLFARTSNKVLNPVVEYITNTPAPTLKPTIKPTKIPKPTTTPIPTPIPTVVTSQELESFFIKFSTVYKVDKELLKRIAKCESNLNSSAVNRNYAGLFQFSDQSWISTRNSMDLDTNPDLRFNSEESIRTAAFMISQNKLSIWPNCNK
ncbi:MAG: transglycosylase SLT domain-containing protein [Candidatus Levybacteria bacterium]|nr:transglycosylase SLT domain-containing protein [Candidatus Levybacteria bacterium]